eukprot:TRINITY_DN313_c0_g2_i1.p1 TRINITY_DN313_c0_g2~~TRINITY_DN313_c0_g2_i1.p1  ORF type:complete len:1518 (+),score=388.08 TRINITY_DN313_c0_g2_i1:55-4608(+)
MAASLPTPVDLLTKGTKVWIPQPSIEKLQDWIPAEIVQPIGADNRVVVQTEDLQEKPLDPSSVYIRNPAILDGVDDMTRLSYMHEPAILHNLRLRYDLDIIYTYTGPILIAMNPYQKLPNLYDKSMIDAYCGKAIGKLSPHVFAVAEDAFRSMMVDEKSQSILVSGESGAGKTESAKYLLQYFAAMGGKGKGERVVEQKVLESTPLLEAFGNAKTQMNDNSSRFGKFIEVQFSETGIINGASIQTYLLEKSRIVHLQIGERCYHVFYQLIAGADATLRQKLQLRSSPEDYKTLFEGECYAIDGVSDVEEFQKTKRAMDIIQITQEEQTNVFEVLAAILHFSNTVFADTGNDSSELDAKTASEYQIACALLGCDAEELKKSMLTREITAGSERYTTSLTAEKAANVRDAFCMLLYSRLFDWLVEKINQNIRADKKAKSFIGILDIYGFESFETNGFEQFCINYANEKLQQQFNHHIFKLEQQEYIKEKIDWSYIEFRDNQECLDLIEKKPLNIIAILDEESMFPRANDESLAIKLVKNHEKHPHFEKPKMIRNGFSIIHYAGKVSYDTKGFLEKNRDFIVPVHMKILGNSKPFVATMSRKGGATGSGPAPVIGGARSLKPQQSFQFVSVANQFRDSLGNLMSTIGTTNPHYIRCIKPNIYKRAKCFEPMMTLHQLRCLGVLDAVRIFSAGYPGRIGYDRFYDRYKILVRHKPGADARSSCEALFNSLNIERDKYQFGLTKLFLRAGQIASFEKMRTDKLNMSALMIQKNFRRFVTRRWYLGVRQKIIELQTVCRLYLAKKKMQQLIRLRAAIKIQRRFRAYLVRRKFLRIIKGVIKLQKAVRRHLFLQKYKGERMLQAAIVIQRRWRAYRARRYFKDIRKATIKAQTLWRGKLARRRYAEEKIAAKAVAAVIVEKKELEHKLDTLEMKLVAESRQFNRLEESNRRLDAEYQALLQKYKELDSRTSKTIARLEDENEKLANENQMLRSKYEKENETLKEKLRDETKAWTKAKTEMSDELQQLRAKLAEEMRLREEERKAFEEEKQKMSASIELMNAELDQEQKDNADLKKQLKRATAKVEPTELEVSIESNLTKVATTQEERRIRLVGMIIGSLETNFASGLPIPAFVLFRYLRYWRELYDKESHLLPYIISSMSAVVQGYREDANMLSFSLSNIGLMLHLTEKELDIEGVEITLPPIESVLSNAPFYETPAASPEEDAPAFLTFQHQLTSLLGTIYNLLLKNLFQKLKPIIDTVILEKGGVDMTKTTRKAKVNSITDVLSEFLRLFQANFVFVNLVQQFFELVFTIIDAIIFNDLLLRKELCTFMRANEIDTCVHLLEFWGSKAGTEWLGNALEKLNHTQQAANLLLMRDKTTISNKKERTKVCPDLTLTQIKQILSLYTPDSFEEKVPYAALYAISKESAKEAASNLFIDVSSTINLRFSSLHYIELEDLHLIPFPKDVSEAITTSIEEQVKQREAIEQSLNLSTQGRNNSDPKRPLDPKPPRDHVSRRSGIFSFLG